MKFFNFNGTKQLESQLHQYSLFIKNKESINATNYWIILYEFCKALLFQNFHAQSSVSIQSMKSATSV